MPLDRLPLQTDTAPMEAKLVEALPAEPGWRFEPKWDGFRCLAFRDGAEVALMSKSGKPLDRYFPEVREMLLGMNARRFILDGELVVPVGDSLSFDALQQRLHPAESRVIRLSRETPAQFMLFDCLADPKPLADQPLSRRREALERLYAGETDPSLKLSPYTDDADQAQAWLDSTGGALDGVVAKRIGGVYEPGVRAMLKVKRMRTADCVVGGFRYATRSGEVGSLLLGLYDDAGLLNHVGFTSGIADKERAALTAMLEPLVEAPGFTGKAPGGPSRWSTDRSAEWQPLRPELVAEVRYDHVTGDRFRHGTRFLRWRPDKAPEQCRMDQLQPEARVAKLEAAIGVAQ